MTCPPDESAWPDPPGGDPDEDPVMLAILPNGGRRGEALAPEAERLLDDWVAGRLAGDRAAVAAALVRWNALAAERALERRLLAAAAAGPDVPPDLSARLRPLFGPPLPPSRAGRGQSIAWRWPTVISALVGALAMASLLAIAAFPLLQRASDPSPSIEVAMTTFPDRSALFEPSDLRLRGGNRTPPADPERRFRDIEAPASLLRQLDRAGTRLDAVALRDLEALLPSEAAGKPARIVVDSTLATKAAASPDGARLPVRLYDLDDPRAGELRAAIGIPAEPGFRHFLLTVRP